MEKNHLKKYRLIREYPGSPKLESIVKLKNNGGYELENSTSYFMTKDKVENQPKFWKEVIEYPIGTRVHNSQTNMIYTKKEDGWYKPASKTAYTDDIITKTNYITVIEDKVIEKDYEILVYRDPVTKKTHTKQHYYKVTPLTFLDIRSVKRLSDGEVFTVGDKIKDVELGTCLIRGFKIINEKMYIIYLDYDYPLEKTIKVKQPLFTTEDGVDIYEGDEVTWLFSDNSSIAGTRKAEAEMYRNLKYFSTKEAAQKYIDSKRVLFYTEDGVGIFEGVNYWYVQDGSNPFNHHYPNQVKYTNLSGLDELDLSDKGIKRFSTEGAAKEYILMNKPSLSLKDVLDNFSSSKDDTKERLIKLMKSRL